MSDPTFDSTHVTMDRGNMTTPTKFRIHVAHPVERADGSAFNASTDLARWRLRYSTSGMGIQVNGPDKLATDTYDDIDGIAVGHPVAVGQDWSVVVDWFDQYGQNSALGGTVTITEIPAEAPPVAAPRAGTWSAQMIA